MTHTEINYSKKAIDKFERGNPKRWISLTCAAEQTGLSHGKRLFVREPLQIPPSTSLLSQGSYILFLGTSVQESMVVGDAD